MDTFLLSETQCRELLGLMQADKIDCRFQPKKNELEVYDGFRAALKLRLPISITSPAAFYDFPADRASYVLILIRSGIASVGYFEDGHVQDHKVFRAYMVRKKQGSSQIKYLKTKGKSRAGSRVRLAESLEFFETINERLGIFFREYRVDRIGLSCPVTLLPYLYGSKVPPPFEKGDKRILKIPKHIQNPTYESLLETNRFLLMGELKYPEEGREFFRRLMAKILPLDDGEEEEENW